MPDVRREMLKGRGSWRGDAGGEGRNTRGEGKLEGRMPEVRGGHRGEEAGCEGRNTRGEGKMEGRMPEVRGGRRGEEFGCEGRNAR